MVIASNQVLARPLYHGPNLHMHILNYVESKIVGTNHVIPQKLPKAMLHYHFSYSHFGSLSGHSFNSCHKAKEVTCYCWPTRFSSGVSVICVSLGNMCPQTHFPCGICSPDQISTAYLATLASLIYVSLLTVSYDKGKKVAISQDSKYHEWEGEFNV